MQHQYNRNITVKIFLLLLITLFLSMMNSCAKKEEISNADIVNNRDNHEETETTRISNETDEKEVSEINYSRPDFLVLVNSFNPIDDNWDDTIQLVSTFNSVGDEVRTEKTTYNAYLELKEELESEGVHIEMDSAYRSVEEQQAIIDDFTEKYGSAYARTYASTPGYSEHHTGLAIDLYFIVDGKTIYENEDLIQYPEIWDIIHEKLPEYGFILRCSRDNSIGYPYEPWHIRYVGPEAAKEISESNITLEEYLK